MDGMKAGQQNSTSHGELRNELAANAAEEVISTRDAPEG